MSGDGGASSKSTGDSSKDIDAFLRARNAGLQARAKLKTVPKRPQTRRGKIIAAIVIVAVVGMTAGFAGGKIADNNGSVGFLGGSLSGQKKIVTQEGQLISQISQDVSPSVVSVNSTLTTTATDFFGNSQPQTEQGAGTGMVITTGGIIMTNRHVVPDGTTKVTVTLSDGTVFENVSVLGRTGPSDSLDVAFLKINDLKGKTLKPVVLGDSSQAEVGDSVVAIGNALGQFQNTVTSGIISGFGRQVQASADSGSSSANSTEDLDNLVQTDAAINEGNSGGPLVNLNGQVIGMNTAIASNAQNIGFALPINDLKGLITQVITTGKFARPFLGVRYLPVTSVVAKQYKLSVNHGAYVIPSDQNQGQPGVVAGSPADKAGIKEGDVITTIDGDDITTDQSLTTLLNKHQPGDKVTLTLARNGKTIKVDVTLGKVSNG
jgi:serine protease Do